MSEEKEESCMNCHYYHKNFVHDSENEKGVCRARPPVFNGNIESAFPAVRWFDWCGEYKNAYN